MATYFSVATPPAYAAGVAEYALYFPDDPATKSDLLAAAKGGGIGSGDTNGILSKTYIISKGGPLGTFIMPLNRRA